MKEHECNTPKHITDEDIVLMFKFGRLRVRKAKSRNPEILSFGRLLKPSIVTGKSNPRWRHEIRLNGKKRTIVRAKLVWLARNGLIPPEHELHHRDEDRLNDSIDNLELLNGDFHFGKHYGDDEF